MSNDKIECRVERRVECRVECCVECRAYFTVVIRLLGYKVLSLIKLMRIVSIITY